MAWHRTGGFVLVIGLLALLGTGQPGFANILQNPGFEQLEVQTPVGWEVQISGRSSDWESDIVQASPKAARTGKVGAMLVGETSFIRQTVNVDRGRPYELSAWVRGNGSGAFKFEYINPEGKTFHEESKSFRGTAEWAQITMPTVAPPEAVRVRLFLRLNGTGELHYDDVSFVAVGEAPEDQQELLADSGWANPQAVVEVLTGVRQQADVTWWGFDSEDSTDFVQAAINSGASSVIIPNVGADWIVRPIFLQSNQEIIFEPGVVVTAKKGEYHGRNDSVFTARDAENLTLRGYGATIRMHKDDYDNPELYEKAEWRMGINLRGTKNVQILGLTIRDTGGDGIYLGRGTQRIHNEDIVIRDIVADNNYRQGISVITARNLLIENSVFKNTGGTPPAAGIDLEPNRPDEVLDNIVVRNSVFENNEGHGIHISIQHLNQQSEPISLVWENLLIRGNLAGINLTMRGTGVEDIPRGEIIIRNCIIEHTKQSGIVLRNKDSDALSVSVENCTLHNVARDPGHNVRASTPIYLEAGTSFGALSFTDVVVADGQDRPVVYGLLRTPFQGDFFNIDGTINVLNPYGAKLQWHGTVRDVDLDVQEIDTYRLHYREIQTLEDYQDPPVLISVAPALRVSPVCLPVSDNLIINSSFEEGDEGNTARPASWSVSSLPYIERSTDAAKSGDFGLRMVADAGQNYYVQQRVPVEAGTLYEAKAWLKSVRNDGGYARLKMEFWHVDGDSRTIQGEVHGEPFRLWNFDDWDVVSMQAEAPANANLVGVLFRFYGPGEVYYDDVSFHELGSGC